MSGWQRSSYPMPKSYYQSINQFMVCDGSYAVVNEIRDLIGIGMSSTLSWALLSWQLQVCPGDAGTCLLLLLLLYWLFARRQFASTWDLVEGFFCHVSSPVAVYACDAQCCQGWGSCKVTRVQLCWHVGWHGNMPQHPIRVYIMVDLGAVSLGQTL